MSKEEFKAMIADAIKRDLPGILKQELPGLLKPLLKELADNLGRDQYQGTDENVIKQLVDSVAQNTEVLSRITGGVQ
jgi:hypothetical protein